MIETDFFILSTEQYEEAVQNAAIEGITVDYFLMEFCDIQGEWVQVE